MVLLSLLSVYNHCLTDDKFERTSTALVIFFMTTCRLIIDFQSDKKLMSQLLHTTPPEEANAEANKPKDDHVKSE